jgi:hypothetical protein
MMSLGIGIIAVPERKSRLPFLMSRLGVSEDAIAWDNEHKGHLYNWWQAIEVASKNKPSHVLIVEDDALPSKNVITATHKLINKYPDLIISLFSFRPMRKDLKSGSIFRLPKVLNGDVAVIYPTQWLNELRADYLKRKDTINISKSMYGGGADELRTVLRPGYQQWSTYPNLVQHDVLAESVLGHKLPSNVSENCLSMDDDASTFNWGMTE